MTELLVSVPEIVKKLLDDETQIGISAPGGVTVGPATAKQQEDGVIVLAESGIAAIEMDVALVKMSLSARCIDNTIDRTERISAVLFDVLHRKGRRVVAQASTSQNFLVHYTLITGGPTLSVGELQDTWEHVLTIEIMVGTEPVP